MVGLIREIFNRILKKTLKKMPTEIADKGFVNRGQIDLQDDFFFQSE